jgi:hypothetical protein
VGPWYIKGTATKTEQQDRKALRKTHTYNDTDFQQKYKDNRSLQQMFLDNWLSMCKRKLHSLCHMQKVYTNIYQKRMVVLNMKPKVSIFKKKTKENPCDLGLGRLQV